MEKKANKILQLLDELCPNGVEYRKLKEVASVSIGEFVHKNKQNPKGVYPVYNGGTSNTGFYDEFNRTANKIIISARGANAGFVNRVFVDFWAGNSCYTISVKEKYLDWNFTYYVLKNSENKLINEQQKGGIPAVSKKQVEEFYIPLPPLAVQEEIVRILDKFTELIDLLEKERELRIKQYEYYREKLLTPTEQDGNWFLNGKSVEWKRLGEVCLETKNIKWNEVKDDLFYIDLSSVSRENHKIIDAILINSDNAPSRAQRIVEKDDIIFGTTRPTLMRFTIIDEKYHNQVASTGYCVLRPNQTIVKPLWIYFNLYTNRFYNYVDKNQEGASYPAISDSKVKEFSIPIPPLEEQERIVGILDKFETLVNDLKEGIPAEIELRRKQYEYYREKLLTFKIKEG